MDSYRGGCQIQNVKYYCFIALQINCLATESARTEKCNQFIHSTFMATLPRLQSAAAAVAAAAAAAAAVTKREKLFPNNWNTLERSGQRKIERKAG
jgi:hypothetical protein